MQTAESDLVLSLIPIVLFTANVGIMGVKKVKELGADEYIIKPFGW